MKMMHVYATSYMYYFNIERNCNIEWAYFIEGGQSGLPNIAPQVALLV